MFSIFKYKKGQYTGDPTTQGPISPFGSVHPVLIIGIGITVLPFLDFILPFNIPKWFYGIGVFTILVGGGLSIWQSSQ